MDSGRLCAPLLLLHHQSRIPWHVSTSTHAYIVKPGGASRALPPRWSRLAQVSGRPRRPA
eukprot:7858280-Pyramimonas_sp.AAC.1